MIVSDRISRRKICTTKNTDFKSLVPDSISLPFFGELKFV